jgi:hypothetical protein
VGARTKAWWETRLLVLLAGAVRHRKIEFVGKDANMDRRFQGWSYVDDLLPQLVTAHPQYARTLESAWAAARHWELVEPQDAPDPAAVMAPVPVVNQIRRKVETSLEVSSLSCRRTFELARLLMSTPPLAEERVPAGHRPAMRQN